jgi:pyruvate kinase
MFKPIITLGPSILDNDKLKKIDSIGKCIYRINGAHADDIISSNIINQVKGILPDAEIMIDLPGNKVRTANLLEPIRLIKGETFDLSDYEINYSKFYSHLKKGDIIKANDSIFTLEVIDIKGSTLKILSHSDGILLTNKGLHVHNIHKDIPFLFERDLKLIECAIKNKIHYVSLSFVRTVEDVVQAKKLLDNTSIIIFAKIETAMAVKNLESILKEVDNINVDRGDLSTDIDILKLAEIQDTIIKIGLKHNKNVYLATQFLKNMENNPIPLIPELIDLCKTLKDGISGIQLSEETAVGKYPIECIKLIFDAARNI